MRLPNLHCYTCVTFIANAGISTPEMHFTVLWPRCAGAGIDAAWSQSGNSEGCFFVPKPVWPGATREHTQRGSATEEQQRQTGLDARTLRVAALLHLGLVVAAVTARYGDAPTAPPRSRPESPVAAPFPLFQQARKHV